MAPKTPQAVLLKKICSNIVASERRVIFQTVLFASIIGWASPSMGEVAPDWREVALGGGPTKAVVSSFKNSARCLVSRDSGAEGVIVVSSEGLGGPHISVSWNSNNEILVGFRSMGAERKETLLFEYADIKEVSLVRRGAMVYAYATGAGLAHPLLALDFPLNSKLDAGAMVKGKNGRSLTTINQIQTTQSLISEVALSQSGTIIRGDWKEQQSPLSSGGVHLVNSGDDPNASVLVKLDDLLPGGHEIWLRFASNGKQTEKAEVTVEGFKQTTALDLNQRVNGGIWIALGEFQTEKSASVSVRLKPCQAGSGSISIDAVHHVWSSWKDDDKDGLPDVWETLSGLDPSVPDSEVVRNSTGTTGLEEFRKSATVQGSGVLLGEKAVIFVDSYHGDDQSDGKIKQPQRGAWHSTRGGPKKTIDAAMKSIGAAKVVELHLDGRFDPPKGGFQNYNGLKIILIPESNGVSMEGSSNNAPPSSSYNTKPSP